VKNATADQTGTRVYEFQIRQQHPHGLDRLERRRVCRDGEQERRSRREAVGRAAPVDRPATDDALYWRARAAGNGDGPLVSDRAPEVKARGVQPRGQLYDPLIHGEMVGGLPRLTMFIRAHPAEHWHELCETCCRKRSPTVLVRWMSRGWWHALR
jgi:hypothetical protein